jgi:hypothetical protein
VQGRLNKDSYDEIVENIRISMHGLMLSCPIEGHPDNCPFFDVRQLPVKDRISWLEDKSTEEVISLFGYHVRCLDVKKREEVD